MRSSAACLVALALALPLPAAAAPGSIPVVALAPIDAEKLLDADAAVDRTLPGPARFAEPLDTAITPATDGAWDTLPDGSSRWRVRVEVPGATDLNFGFTRFSLPQGATLRLHSDQAPATGRGPYVAGDATDGQLWTPVLGGDSVVVELVVPPDAASAPDLRIGRVGAGYRDLLGLRREGALPKAGACNNDVVCPDGDGWRDDINSAVVYSLSGFLSCSGTMVMDVPRDFVPYMLTANHCGIDAANDATLVTYFNFQASACRGPRDGQLNQSVSGSTFRAASRQSDFALVELSSQPPAAFNAYWAGWDHSDTPPTSTVAIHHPNTDEKAITFDDDPLTRGNSCIGGGTDTHWIVGQYESGTTEPGSSGAGIWDAATHSLVGTLSGGGAACAGTLPNNLGDCWGRFARHWTGGGTPATRLSDWLDPAGTGTPAVPGGYPSASIRFSSATTTDSCGVVGAGDANGIIEPGETVELQVAIISTGTFTNVRGTLTALSPGVTVVDPNGTWRDLSSGSALLSDPPHFTIAVDSTATCYAPIDLRLDVSAAEGGPFVMPIQLQVGAPLASDAPLPIADRATSTSRLTVPESRILSGLRVHVNLSHSYIGDITVRIQSPAGTSATLIDRPGVPATGNGCADADMDATFDDASGLDPETLCAGNTPWLSGTARPMTPLAAFDGENVAGTWQLVVVDNAGGDNGTINDWDLVLTPGLSGECTACAAVSCPGQEISVGTVRVRKGAAGSIVLTHGGALSACALGEQVRMASTARPAVDPGSWPTDPAFTDVSGQDLDPAPRSFRHVPPPGNRYYLVVESLPGGAPGPSGSY